MKYTFINKLFLSSMLLTLSLYANHPSFDCSKVKADSTEGLICSSDVLMDLDKQLSKIYKEALLKAKKEDMLKATQRGWIKSRNACWKAEDEKKCINDSYAIRMKELKDKYVLGTKKAASEKYSFKKTFSLQGITFDVATIGEGSLCTLYIKPHGLSMANEMMTQEIDGAVSGAEIADINADGSPEIYVYVTSAGSGSYGSLVAYAANNKKSLSEIYLSPLEDDKKNSVGYMGHDEFTIIENTFARRFPVYNKDDANCCPKGGTRQLEYKLKAGEAGWILKLHKSLDYK